jgi:AmmeMemoRadiSam system protein A
MPLVQSEGLQPRLLGFCNSGDTTGDRNRVVGYAAVGFFAPPPELHKGQALLAAARASIAKAFGQASPAIAPAPWWQEPGAGFVTLTLNGQLRGCIGSLEAHRPLLHDIEANAHAAAFQDHRFQPLTAGEWALTSVQVSLLSPLQAMHFENEAHAMAQLRPGVDGVVLTYETHRSTFLPQVWEQLPAPESFLSQLKIKAGLPADFWAPQVQLFRYTVIHWNETDTAHRS